MCQIKAKQIKQLSLKNLQYSKRKPVKNKKNPRDGQNPKFRPLYPREWEIAQGGPFLPSLEGNFSWYNWNTLLECRCTVGATPKPTRSTIQNPRQHFLFQLEERRNRKQKSEPTKEAIPPPELGSKQPPGLDTHASDNSNSSYIHISCYIFLHYYFFA